MPDWPSWRCDGAVLKPHVLSPGKRLPPSGARIVSRNFALRGGNSIRFANEILARHTTAENEGDYPEAWLVLREEEQREYLEAAGDVKLTQLTLKLVLQISEFLSEPEKSSSMERESLRHLLTHCMTAIETRSRAEFQEIRVLTERLEKCAAPKLQPAEREMLVREIQRDAACRLELLAESEKYTYNLNANTVKQNYLTSGARLEAIPVAQNSLVEQTRRRFGQEIQAPSQKFGFQKSEEAENTAAVGSKTATLDTGIIRTDIGAQTARTEKSETPTRGKSVKLYYFSENLENEVTGAASAALGGQLRNPLLAAFSARRLGKSVLEKTDMTIYRRQAVYLRGQNSIAAHKEQLLHLLHAADEPEQMQLWHLVEEHGELVDRHREYFREESHLAAEEKMAYVVRRSTYEEYSRLLQILEKRIPECKNSVSGHAAPVGTEQALFEVLNSQGTRERRKPTGIETALIEASEPALSWLSQALSAGRIRRRSLQRMLDESEPSVREAFLTLAGESGIFHRSRAGKKENSGKIIFPEEMELLLSESRRPQLEALRDWVREQEIKQEEQSIPAPGYLSAEAEKTGEPGTETEALVKVRSFLRESRLKSRAEQVLFVSAAPPEEREALLSGLVQLAGGEAEVRAILERTDLSRAEKLVYLLEEKPELTASLPATEPVRALERIRQTESEMFARLRTYTEERGEDRTEQRAVLLRGLDEIGKRMLLKRLERAGLGFGQPGMESGIPPGASEERLERLLEFRTQKEYKSFRYHLAQYLREQPVPVKPLLDGLMVRGEQLRDEERILLASAVRPLLRKRPAAWFGELVRKGVLKSPTTQLQAEEMRRMLFQIVEHGESTIYEHLTRVLEHQEHLPPGVLEAALPKLRGALPRQTEELHLTGQTKKSRAERLVQSPEGADIRHRNTAVSGAVESVLQSGPGMHSVRTGAAHRLVTEERRAEGTKLPFAKRDEASALPEKARLGHPLPRTMLSPEAVLTILRRTYLRPRQRESQEEMLPAGRRTEADIPAVLLWRGENGEKSPSGAVLRNTEPPAAYQKRWTGTGKNAMYPVSIPNIFSAAERKADSVFLKKYPDESAVLRREKADKPMSAWAAAQRTISFLRELSAAQSEEHLARPALRRAARHKEMPSGDTGQESAEKTVPYFPPPVLSDDGREARQPRAVSRKNAWSAPVEAALELRRERSGERAQAASQAAVRAAELTVQRQAPELRILRAQSKEQEQALEEQRKSLGGLREQLEQQEKLVRQVLEKPHVSGLEEPAQVRKLAKAVLRELEGQLRLERQRRGIT